MSENVAEMLHRAGVIQERAKRRGESLGRIERVIIESARDRADTAGFSKRFKEMLEMEGQRDFAVVLKKLKVKAKFAYYESGFEEIPPHASYVILESNHPALMEGSNVCAEQFILAGVDVPKSPTYEKWIENGRRIFRG